MDPITAQILSAAGMNVVGGATMLNKTFTTFVLVVNMYGTNTTSGVFLDMPSCESSKQMMIQSYRAAKQPAYLMCKPVVQCASQCGMYKN